MYYETGEGIMFKEHCNNIFKNPKIGSNTSSSYICLLSLKLKYKNKFWNVQKRMIFYLALFCLFNFTYSIEPLTLVKKMKDNTFTTFGDILKQYDILYQRTTSKRREFETFKTYENRIERETSSFIEYTKRVFSAKIKYDDFKLDWENSSLVLGFNFPVPIHRLRGTGILREKLRIVINVDPLKAREISMFKSKLDSFITFHFNKNKELLIDEITISYRNGVIYNE